MPKIIACFFAACVCIGPAGTLKSQTLVVSGLGTPSETIKFENPVSSDSSGRIKFGPDPKSSRDLFQLCCDGQVQQELHLDKLQREAIEKAQQRYAVKVRAFAAEGFRDVTRLKELLAEVESDSDREIQEILLPEQLSRLVQIAYRVEVSICGLGAALTQGQLGAEVGIYENMKTTLASRANDIDQRLEAKILQLYEEAEHELLDQLPADQQEIARRLLGKPYVFRETGPMQAAKLSYESKVQRQKSKLKE